MNKLNAVGKHSGEVVRYIVEDDGNYFVYAKGRKSYGWRYSKEEFLNMYTPKQVKYTEAQKWQRGIKKAIKKLNASGLWPEILEVYKNLEKMSYEDHQEIVNSYDSGETYKKYKDKYPFLYNKDGRLTHWDYVGSMSYPKFKSMYFGKTKNTEVKNDIKNALKDKKSYNSGRCYVTYDVSFEYNAESNKAWYSEEYQGCGNGHYYIAVDDTTAIFYEND